MREDLINWKGRLGPMTLVVSNTTFTPSTVSTLLANELDLQNGDSVIDVGCGTGILSIIAAKLGAGNVTAVDKSPDVVDVGNHNAQLNGVADKITFYNGDLFGPLPDEIQADVIIGDVSGIPDALAADSGWFPSREGGGARGSELPMRMLQDATSRLTERGRLFLPTGTLQDEASILDVAHSHYKRVRMLVERRIPLPTRIAESKILADLVDTGLISITPKGSRYFWEARVWEISAPA
jgi:SAM-dependent methyltransferase